MLFKILLFIAVITAASATIHKNELQRFEKLITDMKLKHPEEKIPGLCDICKCMAKEFINSGLCYHPDDPNLKHKLHDLVVKGCHDCLGFFAFMCLPFVDQITDGVYEVIENGNCVGETDVYSICHDNDHSFC